MQKIFFFICFNLKDISLTVLQFCKTVDNHEKKIFKKTFYENLKVNNVMDKNVTLLHLHHFSRCNLNSQMLFFRNCSLDISHTNNPYGQVG